MPFFQHLSELRRRITIVLVVVFTLSMALYFVWEPIYNALMIPIFPIMKSLGIGKVVALGVFEVFMFRFKVALFGALVLSSPLIAYHTLAFFLPALKPKERRWFVPGLIAVVFFFVLGCWFCWQFILTPGFTWLLSQGGALVQVMPQADKMLTAVLLFMLAFGVGFETPVVVFLVIATGLVEYQTMRKNWRVAYLIICIVSAVVTPDWSWVSMGSLAAAMLVLYEGSMAFSWVVLRKRVRARELAEAEA